MVKGVGAMRQITVKATARLVSLPAAHAQFIAPMSVAARRLWAGPL